ncbi:MAG: DUF368 domain-containing protein [Flavobacteriales bacterium]|nr:DUF368 domain-containing protein [Flavobacteriales bacterium]
MKARKTADYLLLSLRGLAMGAADVVPGVSGGTIAFISGIYEELLGTISGIKPSLLKVLRTEGFKAFWKAGNFSFLLAIGVGVITAIASLAHLISWLLENEPIKLWAFFFGLVLASVFFIGKQVNAWNAKSIVSFIAGAAIAWYITSLPPMGQSDSMLFLFFSGMIGICAMILPGISGSFILLILGSYTTVIKAVKEFDIPTIGAFGAGCVVGILSFSHLLNWMYKKHHDLTVALLTGFLLGSLQKLWPWQQKAELLYTHSDGKEDWLMSNVMPGAFEGDAQIGAVAVCFIIGFAIIFIMERIATKK